MFGLEHHNYARQILMFELLLQKHQDFHGSKHKQAGAMLVLVLLMLVVSEFAVLVLVSIGNSDIY